MSHDLPMVCALGVTCGLGLLGTVLWLPSDAASSFDLRPLVLGAAALAGGALAAWLSGWVALLPIVAVAIWGLPKLLRQTAAQTSIETIEAVASWTEMLQSTLAASSGLNEAILATAPLSPPPIRDAARVLASRLVANEPPREALLEFARSVDEASVDGVICALMLVVTARAHRVSDLLAALAEHARSEATMRLRIETSRASVRSSVRTVVVFSVAFAFVLLALAHAYLSPYATPTGQLVLLVVGTLYATGLVLMVALARPEPPIRLLGSDVERA